MRVLVLSLVSTLALAGCGAVSDLNPFGEKDERLSGDRETVFATSAALPDGASVRRAVVAPARANTDWPQPGGNARNDAGHLAFGGTGSRAWRTSVGRLSKSATRGTLRITARPVVSGNRVYVYAPDGTVAALDANSGSRVWRTSLRPEGERDAAAGGGLTLEGGRLFVATGYSEVSALQLADGSPIWTKALDVPLRGAPTAASGKVFVVSQKNQVFALDQADGTELFTYDGIPEQAGLLAAASPAVSGETVVIPYSSGEVMAFDIGSGEPKWQNFVTRSQRTLAVAGLTDVSGSPVIEGGTVYATGVSGRTMAIGLADGDTRWSSDVGSAHTPVVSGDAVFVLDLAGKMVALDKGTGERLWVTALPTQKRRDRAYVGPVLAGGALYAISNDGRMLQLDPSSGQIVADRKLGGSAYTAPIVAGGRMIYVSDSSEITALR